MPVINLVPSLLLVASAWALPQTNPRANKSVNPAAVTDTQCLDSSVALDSHDTNVAILGICGGIQGAINKCQGSPTSTVGASGTTKISLQPLTAGATLNVSKGRWEGCMRAAAATCPKGTFTSTCVGGVSQGSGFKFTVEGNN